MGWMYYVFALVVVPAHARTIHATSYYDFRSSDSPYWQPPAPFSKPGHIFGSYSVSDLLPIVADFWHAGSLVDAGRRSCRHLESDLSEYLEDVGLNPLIPERHNRFFDGDLYLETVCTFLGTGNIEEICRDVWDVLLRQSGHRSDELEGSQSLIIGHECYRRDYPFPTSLPGRSSLDTVTLRDFNIYDPCSVSGIEKLNNILFALMDWIGPKFFSSIVGYGIEYYGLCGTGRFILSMNVPDFYQNLTGVLRYPVADILEQFQFFDICALSQIDEPGAEAIGAFKDLFVEFSDLDEAEFCDFIGNEQTRESYLNQGEIIVSSIFNLRYNGQSCNDVLDIIAPFDEFSYFHLITDYDPSNNKERREFCSLLVEAYDPSSTYTPTPYEIPADGRIGFPLSGEPGEVLPGLTFVDLMKIDGAAGRGQKIIDGVIVYCDAFEELMNSSLIRGRTGRYFDVAALCDVIRSRDLAEAERMCIEELRTSHSQYYDPPLWLRPYDYYEGFYLLHQLSGIMDLSKEEVCPVADSLLTGESVIHLFDRILDTALTEFLPYVKPICENWEEAVCYWKPYCSEAGQPTPSYNRWYTPSAEEKERRNAEIELYASLLASLGSTLTGFDSREETCTFIAEAIDPLSGRADKSYAERARQQIMGVFTDVDRCSRVVDTALDFIPEGSERYNILFRGFDVTSAINQITGFDTSREFCEAVAEASAGPGGPIPPQPTPGGRLAATYNIIANIVVHVQRVARSL